MLSFKTEGIVIKRRNSGEADRVLYVYTRKHGKLQIKASGVRKITSHRSPHVELLNHTLMTVHKGRVNLILTEAQVLNDFSGVKEDLDKVGYAYHLCELINELCPEGQAHEEVFDLLQETLYKIENSNEIYGLLYSFEIKLLILLGYWHKGSDLKDTLDTQNYIENIIEKRLKSKRIFERLFK